MCQRRLTFDLLTPCQLVPLPRQPCVEDILLEFQELIWSAPASFGPSKRDENLPVFLIGIKAYFEEWVNEIFCDQGV